ncbi:nicotinate phosphoribosyltransferase [Bacillus sp. Xin]|uniref:nicotinate phosphoribosyltransferase n=1 Tax=unclassified Bacillus (in: firmicutes) TaxID=185979 RepID=UPI001573246C|nr:MULTISPECIES: nicotinate phosphoribosyltransferase [unclassified Bacillus (in: firmicutes)]MBC6973843.1 nicotinate phosphoribosyltransferase [Bacillus sp. Xin]NSW36066.1 nicotinate phosphoribosyltransferase [Bacillus sp. Xin1]
MNHYKDDSYALHTDLYQINMAYTYWKDGIHKRRSVFDLYFRKLPFKNGYAIFAGLEKIIEYIEDFRFTDSDIAYLKELGFEEEFLHYLQSMKFTGTIRSMQEGEVVFNNEPLLRVDAPLGEAQIIETALLNIVNYQTLIATKAARMKHAADNDELLEFGTRRAHEFDAALWGTRAAFIGGFSSTSNVRAGKRFGIPVAGTHAHSFVQAYRDEYVAFKKYAETHKKCVFLVDTYDTLKSGVPNAIRVAKEFGDRIDFYGIRLDSGDMAYLSKEARKLLDAAGFTNTKIIASSDLDEYTIMHLKSQGAKIDVWGVGTKLITSFEQPALGAVYKLVAIEDENETLNDTIKISSNPEKITTPGLKRVYRIINRVNGHSEGDYIALETEVPEQEERLKMFHPVHTYISKFVTNFEAKELHHNIFVKGKRTYKLPEIQNIQRYAHDSLNVFWEEYKRTLNPEEYPVDLSQECWDHKMNYIQTVRNQVSNNIQK